jgi:hypothetical protein
MSTGLGLSEDDKRVVWSCFSDHELCKSGRDMLLTSSASPPKVSVCEKAQTLFCSTSGREGMQEMPVCAPSEAACSEQVEWMRKNQLPMSSCARASEKQLAAIVKAEETLRAQVKDDKALGPKAKTLEARQFVSKLYDGARAYYMLSPTNLEQNAPQFPQPNAGPTPPLGECCKQGGQCAPVASYWEGDTWVALQFSVDDPHYYSYEYKAVNDGCRSAGKDGECSVVVTAYGDLDCDGVYSTYQLRGDVSDAYPDGPPGRGAVYRERQLE